MTTMLRLRRRRSNFGSMALRRVRVLAEHFRIDATHSNAFEAWKAMGSPQPPSEKQYRELEAAGQLQMVSSPEWVKVEGGAVVLRFELPRQAVSLVRVTW